MSELDDTVTDELPDPRLDGLQHLNLYSRGHTRLGQYLSNLHNAEIMTRHGVWPSVEAYWYWLKTGCQDDRFRTLSSYEAKQYGRQRPSVPLPEFDLYIREALTHRVVLGRMYNEFIQNRLPFEHYYYYGDIDNCKVIVPDDHLVLPWFNRLHSVLTQPVLRLNVLGSRKIEPKLPGLERLIKRFEHARLRMVTGLARGPDLAGKAVAEALGIPIDKFPADWEKYGRSAGHRRNAEMADVTDLAIVFWDGKSKGTAGMMKLLRSRQIPYVLFIRQ